MFVVNTHHSLFVYIDTIFFAILDQQALLYIKRMPLDLFLTNRFLLFSMRQGGHDGVFQMRKKLVLSDIDIMS